MSVQVVFSVVPGAVVGQCDGFSNTNSAYPRWLTLELSLQQYYEHKGVNGHRDDVNVQPVILDPETIALANYRASHWIPLLHNVLANFCNALRSYCSPLFHS